MTHILCVNPGQDLGGAEVYLVNLIRFLSQRYTFHLLVHPAPGLVEYFQRELHAVSITTASMAYRELPSLIRTARRIIRQEQIDLVHLNGRRAVVLAPFLKFSPCSSKILTTFHSSYFNREESLGKAFTLWLLHFLPLHCCDGVITVSRKVYQERRWQLFPQNKLHLIKNGVDLEHFAVAENIREHWREEIRRHYEIADAVVIGEVGRLVRGKGQYLLLEALARCRQQGHHLKALFVGAGPSRDEFKKLAERLQIDAAVVFAGHQPDTRPFLAAMDVFVLPSLNEGLPLSVLEAMAMNLPVIASRIGGVPELIENGKNGLLVPPDDATALTEAICELIKNTTQRQQLINQAQKTLHAHFDQKHMLAQHEAVFARLLEK